MANGDGAVVWACLCGRWPLAFCWLQPFFLLRLRQLAMVRRDDRGKRCRRWAIYWPSGPRSAKRRLAVLREAIPSGPRAAKVEIEEVSAMRVDLVFPGPRTVMSALRLLKMAGEKDAAFEFLGDPVGIDAKPEPVAAAPKKRLRAREKQADRKKHAEALEGEGAVGEAAPPRGAPPAVASAAGAPATCAPAPRSSASAPCSSAPVAPPNSCRPVCCS